MKGYIYTLYPGADPGVGWQMTDPIYGKTPTLGACMPNVRRAVEIGDYIFSISGRIPNQRQYIIGGFAVDEKINALAAYQRFPENRMKVESDGSFRGNIIVDKNGEHLDFDYHTNHEKRIENYIIGKDPIVIQGEEQIQKAREQTVKILNELFGKNEDSVGKIIGRWRRLDSHQINDLKDWIDQIRKK